MKNRIRCLGIPLSLLLAACTQSYQTYSDPVRSVDCDHPNAAPSCERYVEQESKKLSSKNKSNSRYWLLEAYGIEPPDEEPSSKPRTLVEKYGLDKMKPIQGGYAAPSRSSMTPVDAALMGLEPKNIYTGGGVSEPIIQWGPRSPSGSISPFLLPN